MSSGERPIDAAKGKQSDTEALCQTPPWGMNKGGGDKGGGGGSLHSPPFRRVQTTLCYPPLPPSGQTALSVTLLLRGSVQRVSQTAPLDQGAVVVQGHGATDTELTYTPVSKAYGHRHNSRSALRCLAALQCKSRQCSPQEVAVECFLDCLVGSSPNSAG